MSQVNITRRSLVAATAAVVSGSFLPATHAQVLIAWKPSRPIKIVVPWPPGGGTDLLTRLVAPTVQEILGQPVIVENQPGAVGRIGSAHVYESAPDGHTLIAVSLSNVDAHLKAGLRYDVTKFVPVATLGTSPFLLIGRPDLPANNWQEFIELARKSDLSYANAGIGSVPHILASALGLEAKIQRMRHVPFQGISPAVQALLGSHADAMISITGGTAQYQGKLKFLGLAALQRSPSLPNVPTLAEQGMPFEAEGWMGIFAPPGTPANVTAAISSAVAVARGKPEYKAQLAKMAIEPMDLTQAEFAKYYVNDYNKWGGIIRAANIKLD